MLLSYWKRRQRAKLRHALRGYRLLRESAGLGRIDDVCAKLATTTLDLPSSALTPQFFGAAINNAELATRQYLYLRQVLYKLPQVLLGQLGSHGSPLVYPLPYQWQKSLITSGFAVDRLRSWLLWELWLFIYWGHGVVTIGRLLLVSAAAAISGRYRNIGKFSHFEYIAEAQTPRPASDGRSFDVVSWYRQWPGRASDVKTSTYRGRSSRGKVPREAIKALGTPFLPVLGFNEWLKFAGWSLWTTAGAFVSIFTGKWWHPLLLVEAALGKFASMTPQHALARDYLLNNSGWLYRPLWTYEAESRGSRVLFYHYSTNSASFKGPEGYRPEHYTWPLTNWPLHLVWDEHQADFVRRAIGPATKVDVVGPIWFSSTAEEMVELNSCSIAAFDVQPFRSARYPALAVDYNYYTAETCIAFIRDVSRACAEAGYDLAWKRKRSIGKMAHPLYRKLAADLDEASHVRILPAQLSAIRVIEGCKAAISLPFTSTAIAARAMGKPSCFYDPSGDLQKDDRAAHDIPILTGYEELLDWIRSL